MPKRMGTILSLVMLAVFAAGFLSPPATAAGINVWIMAPTGARPVFARSGSTVVVTIQYNAMGMDQLEGAVELVNAKNALLARTSFSSPSTEIEGTREVALRLPAEIPDGSYNLRVEMAGYQPWMGRINGYASEMGAVVVDNQAPRQWEFTPQPGEVVGNVRPTIAARVEDAARVSLTVNGTAIPPTAFAVEGGILRYLPSNPLPQGKNIVTLTAVDQAGNTSISPPWEFTVDTEPPVLTVVSPAQGTEVDNPKPVISARISDVSVVTLALKVGGMDVTGQVGADGEMVAYLPPEPLPDGQILVELSAADAAGNQAALKWEFAVATRSPVGSLFADTSVINAAGPAFVTIRAGVAASTPVAVELAVRSADAAEWVSLEQRTGVQGDYLYRLDSAALAGDGQYTLRLTGRDAYGVSGASYATILVDRTPPVFTGFKPANDATVEFNRATIYFGYAGADSFHLLVDGQPVDQKQVAVLDVPGEKKAIYAPTAPLEAGKKHQFVVTLVDTAGNTALKEGSFTVLSSRRGLGFGRLWFE